MHSTITEKCSAKLADVLIQILWKPAPSLACAVSVSDRHRAFITPRFYNTELPSYHLAGGYAFVSSDLSI